MLGRKNREQLDLFVAGSLEQLVPEDHILARVYRVLDLGWLREEVVDCYCSAKGRPRIDPEVAVRRMPRSNARTCLTRNGAVRVFVRGSDVYRVFGGQGTGASRALSSLGTSDFLHVNVAKPSGAQARR